MGMCSALSSSALIQVSIDFMESASGAERRRRCLRPAGAFSSSALASCRLGASLATSTTQKTLLPEQTKPVKPIKGLDAVAEEEAEPVLRPALPARQMSSPKWITCILDDGNGTNTPEHKHWLQDGNIRAHACRQLPALPSSGHFVHFAATFLQNSFNADFLCPVPSATASKAPEVDLIVQRANHGETITANQMLKHCRRLSCHHKL